MAKVFLGLGSNIGNRIEYLQKAYEEISKHYKLLSASVMYETEPIGEKNQQNFLNAVVEIETNETPEQLFSFIKTLEKKIGRRQRKTWQPREIDIDILLFGNEIIETEHLSIPHKEMHKRKFVLIPFVEIAPNCVHTTLQQTIANVLNDCTNNHSVTKTHYQFQHI
ncbi:MAG: 2-amino-4-hydroxy-6-hydroxymethyldihydropteridine diphosphokinase [Ignavibacteria bacterium]|nr:2-amino-4-hydroxy-6-hydroxymethyldihydropteridine diphosphokinase [Ignavibacteria bacterium]